MFAKRRSYAFGGFGIEGGAEPLRRLDFYALGVATGVVLVGRKGYK